jgi:thioredoxin-dependent peroxiredoxin
MKRQSEIQTGFVKINLTMYYLLQKFMAQTQLGPTIVKTNGELPANGTVAPDFRLVNNDLQEVTLKDFSGKTLILNIFPSIDTRVCATSVRQFNLKAATLQNTLILSISKDLPFAMKRFCGAEGIDKVITLSDFRSKDFTKDYGVEMIDGPMVGLMARAIVIIDSSGKIIYTEMVPSIGQEPDYDAALKAI